MVLLNFHDSGEQHHNNATNTDLPRHQLHNNFYRMQSTLAKIERRLFGKSKPSKKRLLVKLIAKVLLRKVKIHQLKGELNQLFPKGDESTYQKWIETYQVALEIETETISAKLNGLQIRPRFSIVVPVYRPNLKYIKECIESVKSQVYDNWELILVDDHSQSSSLEEYLKSESSEKIKLIFNHENGHISKATNLAIKKSTGDFVVFLDHDDRLHPLALTYLCFSMNKNPDADLFYTDEDKIDAKGMRSDPHFKTDWNHELFCCMNYINHLTCLRRGLIEEVGGLREGLEGSQDYDLLLRCIEKINPSQIVHIPEVLYHWRAVTGSTALDASQKNYACQAGIRALKDHFSRTGKNVSTELLDSTYYRSHWNLEDVPAVSLLICTRDRADLVAQVIDGCLNHTDYPKDKIEIILVNNQSEQPKTLELFRTLADLKNVRIVDFDKPFNFSEMNNFAVSKATHEIIGLINNDIKISKPEWLREMVAHICRPGIGAVGAKLLYENNTVQHAGVIMGIGGVAGHAHKHFPKDSPGYFHRLQLPSEVSGVTAACMLTSKTIFNQVHGLDEENLKVAFNDVDYCLKVRANGYKIIWTPYAEAYHLESVSRGSDDTEARRPEFQKEIQFMQDKWGDRLFEDPYYNPNLTLVHEDFSLAFGPRIHRPWKQEQ